MLCRYLQLTSPCTARMRPPSWHLKQIYHETGVPSEIRIKISNSGTLSIDDFANLGESSAELLVGIVSILGGVEPLGEGAAATVAKTKIVSAWRKACTHMLNNESLRMRLLEHPLKVPEMTYYSTYDNFRSALMLLIRTWSWFSTGSLIKGFWRSSSVKPQRTVVSSTKNWQRCASPAKNSCQSRPSHPQLTSYSNSLVQTFRWRFQVRRTR